MRLRDREMADDVIVGTITLDHDSSVALVSTDEGGVIVTGDGFIEPQADGAGVRIHIKDLHDLLLLLKTESYYV